MLGSPVVGRVGKGGRSALSGLCTHVPVHSFRRVGQCAVCAWVYSLQLHVTAPGVIYRGCVCWNGANCFGGFPACVRISLLQRRGVIRSPKPICMHAIHAAFHSLQDSFVLIIRLAACPSTTPLEVNAACCMPHLLLGCWLRLV